MNDKQSQRLALADKLLWNAAWWLWLPDACSSGYGASMHISDVYGHALHRNLDNEGESWLCLLERELVLDGGA
jgi:hypothetical protein